MKWIYKPSLPYLHYRLSFNRCTIHYYKVFSYPNVYMFDRILFRMSKNSYKISAYSLARPDRDITTTWKQNLEPCFMSSMSNCSEKRENVPPPPQKKKKKKKSSVMAMFRKISGCNYCATGFWSYYGNCMEIQFHKYYGSMTESPLKW